VSQPFLIPKSIEYHFLMETMNTHPSSFRQTNDSSACGSPFHAIHRSLRSFVKTKVIACQSTLFAFVLLPAASGAVLWNNGPLITHPAGMTNGADRSATSPTSTAFGFSGNSASSFRLADDFVVPTGGWNLDVVRFYAYLTGSGLTSTISALTLRIWNGTPGTGSVIWGDATTNVLAATGFTGIYRTTNTDNAGTTRPIMFADVNLGGLALAAGTYWMDFSYTGAGFTPPVSDPVAPVIGNALQFNATWNPMIDSGSSTQVAIPFVIEGVPEPSSVWISLVGLGMASLRRRRPEHLQETEDRL
jgi:hypothetical protein